MAVKLDEHWMETNRSLVKQNVDYREKQADKLLREYLRRHLSGSESVEDAEYSDVQQPASSHTIDIYA